MSVDSRAPWLEQPSWLEYAGRAIVLALVLFIALYPILAVISTSLATQQEIDAGGGFVLLPTRPTLAAYQMIFSGGVVMRALAISIGITTIGTLVSVALTVAMAYGLSRPILGGKPMLLLALFTLFFFPGIIPNYLMVKQLGLLNTYAALIAPVAISGFNFVVMRQFFMSIPQELSDAARIDGAGDLGILWNVVLPLSKAVIAVVTLFYAVAYWNNFFSALLYLSDSAMWPLPLVVRTYVLQGAHLPGALVFADGSQPPAEQALQMAMVIVAILPILLVYPFLQKYFTTGVLRGAIKG